MEVAMATYKLTYLNIRARGELIRFILSYAELEFEDCRIEAEKWPEVRPKTLYGILPTLEFDGRTISGNGPIARYLAQKHGLAGETAEENADIDSIVDCVEDIWHQIIPVFREQDEERKKELRKTVVEKYLPLSLRKMEETVVKNGAAEGWVYRTRVTYADLAIFVLLEALAMHEPSMLDKFPALSKLKASVEQLPAINKWIKSRPETKF